MGKLEQQIWKEQYVQPMFKKYECVPTELKYKFIEKDYAKMFGGKREAESRMKYMYDDSETFIFAFENALYEFGKVSRKNLITKYWEYLAWIYYVKLAQSGSYFKYYSGVWKNDKQWFIDKIAEKENKKEYVKLILE